MPEGAIKFLLLYSFCVLLSACSSTKYFTSKDQYVPEIIESYLEKGIIENDDFLAKGIQADTINYCPVPSEPYWVIPSEGLAENLNIQDSNNNVSIEFFNGKLYLAFRTGPTHFASSKTGVYVISSRDGISWEEELSLFLGRDVREPFLIEIENELHFYCFTAGTQLTSFQPNKINHYKLDKNGKWEGPEEILTEGEVHWSLKERFGKIYMTSYKGSHYQLEGASEVDLYFKYTENGKDFEPDKQKSIVYKGGVSECAFEFDYEGNLWAVTRLEDGDESGFGSHVIFADKQDIYDWEFPEIADDRSFMSPKLFNHNNEIYLIARRQLGRKPFGRVARNRSMKWQRLGNWIPYSLSAKTTALFKINKEQRKVEWLMDLPGAGDTAFPSIQQLDQHRFLIANYSSPTQRRKKRTWLSGQLGKTGIYLQIIDFQPCD